MTRVYPTTPPWVKLTAAAALTAAVVWWIADWRDRRGNEQRLGAIASQIAGRHVDVHCPGPLARLIGWDVVEGSVRFDADGTPQDETKNCARAIALPCSAARSTCTRTTRAFLEGNRFRLPGETLVRRSRLRRRHS